MGISCLKYGAPHRVSVLFWGNLKRKSAVRNHPRVKKMAAMFKRLDSSPTSGTSKGECEQASDLK